MYFMRVVYKDNVQAVVTTLDQNFNIRSVDPPKW